MQDYVNVYHGQLVDSSHFINMFYERFEHLIDLFKRKTGSGLAPFSWNSCRLARNGTFTKTQV